MALLYHDQGYGIADSSLRQPWSRRFMTSQVRYEPPFEMLRHSLMAAVGISRVGDERSRLRAFKGFEMGIDKYAL